jgi:hypothetical protein
MKTVKALLMILLVLAGIVFVFFGCGGKISSVEYHGLVVRDIPIGLGLVISAIALACFWRIEEKTNTREVIKDGVKEWIKTSSTTIRTFRKKSTGKKPWE